MNNSTVLPTTNNPPQSAPVLVCGVYAVDRYAAELIRKMVFESIVSDWIFFEKASFKAVAFVLAIVFLSSLGNDSFEGYIKTFISAIFLVFIPYCGYKGATLGKKELITIFSVAVLFCALLSIISSVICFVLMFTAEESLYYFFTMVSNLCVACVMTFAWWDSKRLLAYINMGNALVLSPVTVELTAFHSGPGNQNMASIYGNSASVDAEPSTSLQSPPTDRDGLANYLDEEKKKNERKSGASATENPVVLERYSYYREDINGNDEHPQDRLNQEHEDDNTDIIIDNDGVVRPGRKNNNRI